MSRSPSITVTIWQGVDYQTLGENKKATIWVMATLEPQSQSRLEKG